MSWPVVRLGDTSNHGGAMITAGTKHVAGSIEICRVGDLLDCPIHGVNPIVTGSPKFISQGHNVCRGDGGGGSVAACGAIPIGTAPKYVCD